MSRENFSDFKFAQMTAGTGGLGTLGGQKKKGTLPDHRPLCLNADDYHRVKEIPKKKVCNFLTSYIQTDFFPTLDRSVHEIVMYSMNACTSSDFRLTLLTRREQILEI